MHLNQKQAHEPFIESLQQDLIDRYNFSVEEIRAVQNWGLVVRTVIDLVPIDQSVETYEYAWYLRGDRSDLPPHLQFEGFPSVEGIVAKEDLASLGSLAVISNSNDLVTKTPQNTPLNISHSNA